MTNVAVLGAGSWGTALAKLLADKQNPTLIWSHRADLVQPINERRENPRYLPGAALPPTLRATSDLEEALRSAELVVCVVPSHALHGTSIMYSCNSIRTVSESDSSHRRSMLRSTPSHSTPSFFAASRILSSVIAEING